MKETEVTVEVFNDLEEITTILDGCGFRKTDEYTIYDRYFTLSGDISGLSYRDLLNSSILVRSIDGSDPVDQIIFKKKEYDEHANVISEEKTKAEISDPGAVAEILKLAGLNEYCDLTNHSLIFENGNICFALQIVSDLGIFIEYEEDETMAGLDPSEKIVRMSDRLKGLGLKLGNDFSCKKVAMKLALK